MASTPKIKIDDAPVLRSEIDFLTDRADQITLCRWALIIARRVLPYLEQEFPDCQVIQEGFAIQQQWQAGLVRMHDVRQAGFRIHEIARQCRSDTAKYAARAAGQAVGVGHMREHAMVCSDYVIKTLNCDPVKNSDDIRREREFQLEELRKLQKTSFL